MKKVILTTVALMIGVSAFSYNAVINPTKEFQNYIIRNLSYGTSFVNDGIEGTIKVKVDITPTGIESVSLISGLNEKIDSRVLAIIKNTPTSITSKLAVDKSVSMIIPVTLVINN